MRIAAYIVARIWFAMLDWADVLGNTILRRCGLHETRFAEPAPLADPADHWDTVCGIVATGVEQALKAADMHAQAARQVAACEYAVAQLIEDCTAIVRRPAAPAPVAVPTPVQIPAPIIRKPATLREPIAA